MSLQPAAEKFRSILRECAPISPASQVLVACSGGLDSVVLLHLFRAEAERIGLRVSAAHFDHQMRETSVADANWVSGLCRAWDVPLQLGRAGRSLRSEADARAARYAFLEEAGAACGADFIATAHHADDQAETVLFRLLRGTGLDGVSGIPVKRGRIIRPLLTTWRNELKDYASENRLGWREDPTNRSLKYARNRIRLELLPAIESTWPGARKALVHLAHDAANARRGWELVLQQLEQDVVISQDMDTIELARPVLLKYHPDIRARLLRRWLARLGSRPGRSGTGAIEAFISAGESGAGIHVKAGLRLDRAFETFRLTRPRVQAAEQAVWITSPVAGEGRASIGGARYEVRWSLSAGERTGDTIAIDPAAVTFPLQFRAWRPGDRIRLPYGSKKLKKLFAERRFSRARRIDAAVLAEADGNVLWISGLARSASAQPLPEQPALRITVRDGKLD